ncbi:protein of unknown function DUF820 [Rippkaea orientalis PCC 8801]|uniref:Putative restriction endonuclease domain-containing protein n=1 Tax=Rippkaea orientalis (strain PCC 8801 / RF-1) TaxID=41431 RepID=B7K3R8_RIPO1|nr:Uma2 family endonuclease [Rippkaea orientalis]ACK66458.1 protein of unknown function DUF820 [Rippkaea orientalis PCC 8801]
METVFPYLEIPAENLIYDDGEPLESNRHRIAMNVLISSIYQSFADRQDFFAGGNMFVYYSATQRMNRDFRGPDFFVTLNVDGNQSRKAWVVWNENGRYPDVIVELMSPSTAVIDKTIKKDLYEQIFKTKEYYIFDPFESNSLQGWRLDDHQHYQEIIRDQRGWLSSETLELYLGTWYGTIHHESASWLRFYNQEGHLILLPEEAAQQQAEIAQQQAEMAKQQAKMAEERAETAEQKAQRLANRLRELGINPDEIE